VLKNQHVILQHGGVSLLLAGVTDFSAHHSIRPNGATPQRRFKVHP